MERDMIRLIRNFAIIIISFAIIDFLSGHLLQEILKKSPDGRFYKTQYSLEESDEDIIIYGSSRAETNYAPEVFKAALGLTCWNAGRGGQRLPFMYAINKGILNRYTPKIAIINIERNLLEKDPQSHFFDRAAGLLRPFYEAHEEIRHIVDQVSPTEQFLNRSNFYAFNSSYYYLLRPFAFKGIDGKKEDKGWKPGNGTTEKSHQPHLVGGHSLGLDSTLTRLFDDFIASLAEGGTKVFLVISPDYNKLVIETPTLEYLEKMDKISLLDHSNNDFFISNHYLYQDNDHLNKEGAILFSKLIAEEIQQELNTLSPKSELAKNQ
jgi:hypothetical protein